MKKNLPKLLLMSIGFVCLCGLTIAQRQMEKLNRGVVAVRTSSSQVFVSWRLFGNDDPSTSFNLYRGTTLLNSTPITGATNYTDNTSTDDTYSVKPVINGVEQASSESASVWSQFYKEISLQVPAAGVTPPYTVTNSSTVESYPSGQSYTYAPNDCSVGDVDGDGEYEIIVKWDPSNSRDNSQGGYTGNVYLDAYKLDGTFLWRIDLGTNIRAGAHYTQFMVYDLDGDGKAEVACKTAPGTKDGKGNYLTGAASGTDNTVDYRTGGTWPGFISSGPEYLTVFNGQTGAEIQTILYEPNRDPANGWGKTSETYNRVDRFLACIAYLDGKKPNLVMCRGYYGRCVLVAYDFSNKQLTKKWAFDSNTTGNSAYAGQGCHALCVGDVDNDGFDEIVYGACTIDHDGKGKYSTGLGHGDALHLGDFDPDRPGLEVWQAHENGASNGGIGASFRDANTGTVLWKYNATTDIGRGMAADVTGTSRGVECWAASSGLYSSTGTVLSSSQPASDNFGIWWDGDDQRELLDGTKLDKYGTGRLVTLYNYATATACNGTKNTPNLQADILGDWREEVILHSSDNNKLIIFTTTTPTTRRLYTLMHDPIYRLGVAWQNVAYNQPPDVSYYLGNGMAEPPVPPVQQAKLVWKGDNTTNAWDVNSSSNWLNNGTAATFNQRDTVMFDVSGSNAVPINLAGSISPGYVIVHSPVNYSFNGAGNLTGAMNLIKAGKGTLTFNTVQKYTGITNVNEGTLLVNDSLKQSPVSVGSFAQIGGNGIVKSLTLQSGATIVPGNNGIGKLTISSNMILVTGNTVSMEINKQAGTNDTLSIKGSLVLSGTLTMTNIGATALAPGDKYKLFEATSITGSFGTITPTLPGTGLVWDTTALRSSGSISVKGTQTITFSTLTNKTHNDAPFDLTATATSGLPVTYSSSDPSVVTISGSTVTIVAPGNITITASQAGNASYLPASNVTQSLSVNKAPQTISFGDLTSKKVGDAPFDLTATSSSGLAVTYTSSTPGVATVSGSTVTIVGSGTTTITASQAGNTNYAAAPDMAKTLNVTNTDIGLVSGQDIIIAPNPVADNLTVTFGTLNTKAIIDIYSLSGVQLYHHNAMDKTTIVDMTAFQSGSYIVKITSPEGLLIKQIIKL